MHFISRRRAAQVGQARTANQHMGRVRVIQRGENAQLGQQRRVVMGNAQAVLVDLLGQAHTRFDGGEGQITHAVGPQHFTYQVTVYQAHAAFAGVEFKLY